jgi:hypothetical protein
MHLSLLVTGTRNRYLGTKLARTRWGHAILVEDPSKTWPALMTTTDIVALIGVAVSIGIAIYSKSESTDAKIKAKNAELRSEEALALAKKNVDLKETQIQLEAEALEREKAAAEAVNIINTWVNDAKQTCLPRLGKSMRTQRTLDYQHTIQNLAELLAAQTAATHPEVHSVLPGDPKIGGQIRLYVFNPYYHGGDPNFIRGRDNPYKGK